MFYNELFLNYKHTLPNIKILLEVKPIKSRLLLLLLLVLLGITLVASFIILYEYLSDTLASVYGIVSAFVACSLFILVEKMGRLDISDLLRHYRNIDFSIHEQKDQYLILHRIKKERLLELLGSDSGDLNHIRKLIELSKEYSEQSKIQLVSIKEIGFSAAVILLLNQYFSALYKKWEVLSLKDLTTYTLFILFAFLVFFLFYSIGKKITSDWLNSDYRKHKALYLLLKEIEEMAMYNKIFSENGMQIQ